MFVLAWLQILQIFHTAMNLHVPLYLLKNDAANITLDEAKDINSKAHAFNLEFLRQEFFLNLRY